MAVPARSQIDPAALMKIRSLELRARVVVEGFQRGLHRSPYHGFSVEFTEYRPYAPGDDVRFLDWRLYARSDRDYVKKYEDETNLHCHLVFDHSRSMVFGSLGWDKARYGATLAATLAHFLDGQGDAVGLVTFSDTLGEHLPPRHRPGHLRRLMLGLEHAPAGRATELAKPLGAVAELVRRRGLIVVISDLLAPLDGVERPLGALAAAGHEVAVFQVLDPAELAFSFDAPALFRDLETDRPMLVEPDAARGPYQRAVQAHIAAIRDTCRRLGIDHHLVPTDRPLELALFDLLAGRRARRLGRR
jgi:uncharacterized protein (DUF58 family)